jgi:tetratricopeptide (TPR) repeat protein
MGNALLHLSQFAEAESTCVLGLKMFPDDGDILGNLTISLTFQGKHLEAQPFAMKRLSQDRNVHSLEEAGVVLKGIGTSLVHSDLPKALEHLGSAAELLAESISLNPLYSTARLSLARTLFEMELFSEALDVASKLEKGQFYGRERIVLNAECLNRVGLAAECLEFCSKWKSQLQDEKRLLRVEMETIADFYFIGMDSKDGRKVVVPQCLEFFTNIVEDSQKRQVSDFGYLSRIKEWMDAPEDAMSIAQKARDLYGDTWQVFFSYAWLQGRTGQWESAHFSSKKVCELAPWHPPVWRQMAWIEEHLGMSKQSAVSRTKGEELSRRIKEMRHAAREALRLRMVID